MKRLRIYKIDTFELYSIIYSIALLNDVHSVTLFHDQIAPKYKDGGSNKLNKALVKRMKEMYKDKFIFYVNALTKKIYL